MGEWLSSSSLPRKVVGILSGDEAEAGLLPSTTTTYLVF